MSSTSEIKIEGAQLLASNTVDKNLVPNVISSKPIAFEAMEIIDLTNDEYVAEFKSINTLREGRTDKQYDKSCKTNSKLKNVKFIHAAPLCYLSKVIFHQDTSMPELFGIKFKNIMLYGKLTKINILKDFTVYELDDGTASHSVFYRPTGNKYLDYLNKLNNCEDLLRSEPLPQNEESTINSKELRSHLSLLIRIAKFHCSKRLAEFKLGQLCFVSGRLFVSQDGQVNISAWSIFPDGEHINSCELLWKSYLISQYQPIISKSKESTHINEALQHFVDGINKILNKYV
ncbi:uncharacterized protein LOC128725046 [Anopheles nili]|uniref:uncharacterized protein LOC128725046 n=1 Tax=Anopheles nili TaxID=185578 RepID=UPI00237A7C42|nr:uncharacterized protein LOC128725046 [Anopheles nili]